MRRLAILTVLLLGARAAAAADLLGEAARTDETVERQVHAALSATLAGDVEGTRAAVRELAATDEARAAAGRRRSGLADNMEYLSAGLMVGRDGRRQALEAVLDDGADPVVTRLGEHALEADDAAMANQLLADDRHNRRAGLLNDAIRPFGVFSGGAFLAAVNPFLIAGSAVDSIATTAVNLWNYNRLSAPEREALVRYRTQLEREPRTRDAPEMAHAVRRLGEKRARALCTETITLSTRSLDAGDLDGARFYLDSARALDDCAERTEKPLDQLAKALAVRSTAREQTEWPADEPLAPSSGAESDDYTALLQATVLAEPDGMMAAARRFLSAHDESDLAPGAHYVVAVARDISGHRDEARSALETVSDDDSHLGRQASALLDSSELDGMASLDDAESRHTRQVARYVLLGSMDGRTAIQGAAQLGAQGAQAAQSLGIVNVIGMATRAWSAWRKDPVSNQEIIDRGEELLARQPDAPDAAEVHERLANAYEREGNFARALMHYRSSDDPSDKRIAKLEGKLADRMLEDAQGSHAEPLLLESIVQHFPDSDAAETARERLKEHPRTTELLLDRELLLANPRLAGPAGLDLEPALLDGDGENGELDDQGVSLLPDGAVRLKLRAAGDDDDREETRPLSSEQLARARAAAETALYTRLLTRDERDQEVGRFERYIPVYIQGSVGEDGVAVVPAIKMRRYRSQDRALYE